MQLPVGKKWVRNLLWKMRREGNPNSDNGLTPVTFEGLKGKEREERGRKEEEEKIFEHIPAVYCAYREI